MTLIPEAVLTALRATYESALADTVVHLQHGATSDGYGDGHPSYSTALSYSCLYLPDKASPELMQRTQVYDVTGQIDLPRAAYGTINRKDRLKITHIHGDALATALTFEIIQGPTLNQVGHRVRVKLVQND